MERAVRRDWIRTDVDRISILGGWVNPTKSRQAEYLDDAELDEPISSAPILVNAETRLVASGPNAYDPLQFLILSNASRREPMSIKSWIVRNIRSAAGTDLVLSAVHNTSRDVRSELLRLLDTPRLTDAESPPIDAPRSLHASGAADGLEILPGTPYQRVLMPLEYHPSRQYQSRWGYSRPPHQGLLDLFRRRDQEYREVIGNLRGLSDWLSAIPRQFTNEDAPRPGWVGGPITPLDSALIYYFVQHYRPATYLEIGSGVSTCFAKRAMQDHGLATRIVSIDPEPRASIDTICDQVIRAPLETADLGVFASLQPGDIVFMDGSHRSFMNSDVTVFMLDVLPLLKPGVIIHIHDIVLPYDYHDSFKNWYWNEQYIVAVYLLAARERIEILMPSEYVTTTDGLKESVWPPLVDLGDENDRWRHGGSLWLTHIAPAT
jgi:hypothetical protein